MEDFGVLLPLEAEEEEYEPRYDSRLSATALPASEHLG
jgi:hypothetical protein